MIITGIIGFCLGFFLPAIASRFGKVLPADPGLILLHLFHKPHFPTTYNVSRQKRLQKKWIKLLFHSLLWGIIVSCLYVGSEIFLATQIRVYAQIFFILISFCIIIDCQYFLLPDFFTIPLLLIGFTAASFVNEIPIEYSLVGAFFGYFVSVFSVFMMGLIQKAEFGAGDVKMVTALGVWLGAPGLNFTLLLSFLFFSMGVLLHSKRSGAFGPPLGIAAIIAFFIIYAK